MVTPLSWRNWDASAWQQLWIYRRHFTGGPLINVRRPGNRIMVEFEGVMVNATVVINDRTVSTHQGGYLPFSAELTGHVSSGDNLLAVLVDANCLPVPPMSLGRGPTSVDFFQPGGIYRDVRLRVLPQAFLSDMFALPADALTSQPRVDVECTIDSALSEARRRDPAGRAVRRGPAGRPPGHAGQPGHARRQHRQAEPDRARAGHLVVHRQPEAVHRAGHAGRPRRGQPRPVPADRVPGGVVPARRLLPERPAATAVRPEPAPALPVRRHGDACPGAAQGRGDPEAGAQLQHGPLLALPAVAALPRRLRRARAAGLGRGTGLAQRERQSGLAGPGGAERARHGDQGPEPAVGRHLGYPAQRDARPPWPVGGHQAGRRPARRLAAQLGSDGLPPGDRVERGRIRVQRLRP